MGASSRILISNGLSEYSNLKIQTLYSLSIYRSLLFILFNIQFKYLKGVDFILNFFKLKLYSLTFTINSLKAAFNISQKGYIYRELLKSSYHIKVLQVLRTIPNHLSNISIEGIKEADKYFVRICWQGIIYIIITHSKRSR